MTFSIVEGGLIINDQTGSPRHVFGTALDGELMGSQLHQMLSFPHFWFAWAAFQPDALIYSTD